MSDTHGLQIHEPRFDGPDKWYQDDRANVSAAHRELQHRALKWISNRVTGIAYGAVEIFYRYTSCDAMAVGRFNSRWDIGGDQYRTNVIVFEAKVSKSDFLSTFGDNSEHAHKRVPIGNFHFLVKPRNVVMPLEKLPEYWGVLEGSGRGLRLTKPPTMCRIEGAEAIVDAIYSILHYGSWGKRQLLVPCPDCKIEEQGQ